MHLPDILVLSDDAADYSSLLSDLGANIAVARNVDEGLAVYRGQSVLLGQPDLIATCVGDMPAVRWVQSSWAGVTPLLKLQKMDFVLTGIKDIFGPQMAEYVFGHLLSHTQKISSHQQSQTRKAWNVKASSPLHGRCMGIMGTGSIGAAIAQLGKAFGMRIIGLNRKGAEVEGFDAIYPAQALSTFLAQADFVIAVLPDTPETTNLLNDKTIRQMKPGAMLVNVGRGNVVDEEALCSALANGALSAAVLDVFKREPLPGNSPLWDAPRLTLTPHIAAQSWPQDIARIFRRNYQRYLAGQPLKYVIDPTRGY